MVNRKNIVVDIGNSRIKSGEFEQDKLIEVKNWANLAQLKSAYTSSKGSNWIFSIVGEHREEIAGQFPGYPILTYQTPLPVSLDYKTPETLGMDRVAAAVGARELHPGRNILVIDAGSCITYDIMDAKGVFQGGVIAPGLQMRMKAMHHFTRQLPDISPEWESLPQNLLGKSTRECLLNGAYLAAIYEIESFIAAYKKEFDNLVVMLTGGDTPYFESKLKAPIFANFELVLIGLNRILRHNNEIR